MNYEEVQSSLKWGPESCISVQNRVKHRGACQFPLHTSDHTAANGQEDATFPRGTVLPRSHAERSRRRLGKAVASLRLWSGEFLRSGALGLLNPGSSFCKQKPFTEQSQQRLLLLTFVQSLKKNPHYHT